MELTTAQKQAIEARGTSVAVSAAAGSGKTTVMTRRIIERICEPGGDISRILAVTFTKAAAAEMLSRASRALSDKLASDPSNTHIARQALLVGSAKISTIHSFCLDVIRDNFSSLALPSDFSPADEATLESIMKKETDRLIDDYFDGNVGGDDAIADFKTFSDTFGSLKNLSDLGLNMIRIYGFFEKKVGFIDTLDDYIQMYKNIDADDFFACGAGKILLRRTQDVIERHLDIMSDFLAYAESNDDYASGVPMLKYEVEYLRRIDEALKSGAGYFEVAKKLCDYHPEKNSLRFKNGLPYDEKLEFYKGKRGEFRADLVGSPSSPAAITAVYYSFTRDDLADCAERTAKLLSDLKMFLTELDRRFVAEKKRRHIISFADMEHYALRVLWDREKDAPSDEARRIADGFDEIYIDEYQDTNEVQDKIFALISKGDNVFRVGDIKQSIYAFRGAEPEIFSKILDGASVYKDGFAGKSAKIFLSENFRSSNEIVSFCNSVFETVMNAGKEHYSAAERLYPSRGKSCGEVEVAVMTGDDAREREAEYVAARISAMIRSGVSPDAIAILLRSSTSVGVYESALKAHGVPYDSSMDKRFFESPEVLMVLSLLSAIDNPARDVYVAASLKSPVFGVSLDELIYIRKNYGGSLYDALCAFTEETGFKKGARFISFINEFRALSRSLSCDKLIRRLYLLTDVMSAVKGESDVETEAARANLLLLYNYSIAFSRTQHKSLYDFITLVFDTIEGRRTVSISGLKSAPNAVHITTIHGSKGLEFPVCFLCNAAGAFSTKDMKAKTRTSNDIVAPLLRDSSGLGHVRSPYYEIAGISLRQARQEEEMRLLYVALTRAMDKLIVTASSKGTPDLSDSSGEAERRYISAYTLYSVNNYLGAITIGASGKNTCVFRTDPEADETEVSAENESVDAEMTLTEARRLVNDRLSFKYPYAAITDVPSKTAVSDLFPDLLDEDDGAEETEPEDYAVSFSKVPRFIAESDDKDAARRGTATHTFMQFFDFDRVDSHGIDGEIKYLTDRKFIFGADAELIDKRAIEKFFASPLARKMRTAKKIWREKRFIIGMDASLFTEKEEKKNALVGEEMLVQGVIDCAFEDDDGTVTVIDYKTDHFARGTPREEIEKTLKERHSRQLGYYRAACEEMFGKVGHVYIYSFAIGDTVEITGG